MEWFAGEIKNEVLAKVSVHGLAEVQTMVTRSVIILM